MPSIEMREFPDKDSFFERPIKRREFLKIMAASIAMAGLTSCAKSPIEKIIPYAKAPEDIVPGKPSYFATAALLNGVAQGIIVESHMGRPTNIESNPSHQESPGGLDIFSQSSILTLYDPERSASVLNEGRVSDWSSFKKNIETELRRQKGRSGSGVRLLTGTIASPSLEAEIMKFLEVFPKAKWHQYEPVNRDSAREGIRAVFGGYFETRYEFARAEVVLSLGCDFLSPRAGHMRYINDFFKRRRVRTSDNNQINRLYVVENMPSITGAAADHRLALPSSYMESFAAALAVSCGVDPGKKIDTSPVESNKKWIQALSRDLFKNRSRCLVAAGDEESPSVHALAHAINAKLQNIGQTVKFVKPVDSMPVNHADSLNELVYDIKSNKVEFLAILDSNPAFSAPCDIDFKNLMTKVNTCVHMGLYADETAGFSRWHVPMTHFLESWSDARASNGEVTIIQPLIQPLYNGLSPYGLFALLRGSEFTSPYASVKDFWKNKVQKINFAQFWKESIHNGFVKNTAFKPEKVEFAAGGAVFGRTKTSGRLSSKNLEVVFRPDPTIWDGRFANNAWLQELPKPLTKIAWENAAFVSPKTAGEHSVQNGDVIELNYRARNIKAPAWIMPGMPDYSVVINLGYGRTLGGEVAKNKGFNAYRLRTSNDPWFGQGLTISKTTENKNIAQTQVMSQMNDRDLVREINIDKVKTYPDDLRRNMPVSRGETLYGAPYKPGDYAWGMSIDLSACIGCNSCVIACRSENNIPVVGKQEIIRGRSMDWIKVDRYYKEYGNDLKMYFQPVFCQHCENAPCEPMCPVTATLHSPEGLNEMIYNRCVGVRYCAANCPYKVRRFNFLQYADQSKESSKLMRNPDVTTRPRGVMEKCTYCVQRINAARITAKKEGRKIREGDFLTACQAACPTGAIVFGDLNDLKSKVSKEKTEPAAYGLLSKLNTKPRTTYLAKIINPNPDIGDSIR